jgi:hypothetical protein
MNLIKINSGSEVCLSSLSVSFEVDNFRIFSTYFYDEYLLLFVFIPEDKILTFLKIQKIEKFRTFKPHFSYHQYCPISL